MFETSVDTTVDEITCKTACCHGSNEREEQVYANFLFYVLFPHHLSEADQEEARVAPGKGPFQ